MYEIIEYENKYEEHVKKLVISVFVEEYGFEQYRDHYEKLDIIEHINNGNKIWLALDEDEVIGTILLIDNRDDTAQLKMMYVKKEYRGAGIAQKLLDNFLEYAIIKDFKKIFLGTYEKLERAINFYKKNGFIEYNRNQHSDDDIYFYLDLKREEV